MEIPMTEGPAKLEVSIGSTGRGGKGSWYDPKRTTQDFRC